MKILKQNAIKEIQQRSAGGRMQQKEGVALLSKFPPSTKDVLCNGCLLLTSVERIM